VLLVPFWSFVDRDILDSPRLGKPDMHSGEFETSLMLALRPDLVRSGGVDMTAQVEGFEQADLNTFGFGYNAPEGAYGSPSLASREKGERIVESIKRNMLRHVRQRLEWLEKNRTYSGKGLDER
jgi:creatinine amidohydrolase